eukprot:TRINITY_DN8552_c0_g1_i2.p1 TRINITY_DN8552_c0_g1~~TRINITY_DN8552_c0_g1_i2.p1  ORF type:complete len:1103 (-),score=171.71 TRINITY_DN8552_c0_g1_i2:109-3279(-)
MAPVAAVADELSSRTATPVAFDDSDSFDGVQWQTFQELSWFELPLELQRNIEKAWADGNSVFQVSLGERSFDVNLTTDPGSIRGWGTHSSRLQPLRRWMRKMSVLEGNLDFDPASPLQTMPLELLALLYPTENVVEDDQERAEAELKEQQSRTSSAALNPQKRKDSEQIRLPPRGTVPQSMLPMGPLRELATTLTSTAAGGKASGFSSLEFRPIDDGGLRNVLRRDDDWYCELEKGQIADCLGCIRDLADEAGISHNFLRFVIVSLDTDENDHAGILSKDIALHCNVDTNCVKVPRVAHVAHCAYVNQSGSQCSWTLSDINYTLRAFEDGKQVAPFSSFRFVACDKRGTNYIQTDSRWSSPLPQEDVIVTLGKLRWMADIAGISHNICDNMLISVNEGKSRLNLTEFLGDDSSTEKLTLRAVRGLPSMDIRRLRICVWRDWEWHPVSPLEEEELKRGLMDGHTCIRLGNNTWRSVIDTAGRHGWVQVDRLGGQRRMACFIPPGATSRYVDDLAKEKFGGVDEDAADLIHLASRMSIPPAWECRHGLISVLEDEYHDLDSGTTRLEQGAFYDVWTSSWKGGQDQLDAKLLRGQSERYKVTTSSCPRRAQTSWDHRMVTSRTHSPIMQKDSAVDNELLSRAEDFLISLVDVSKCGSITLSEWVHFRLLQMQAPSQAVVEEIREKLGSTGTLTRILGTFMEACSGQYSLSSARISGASMNLIAKWWIEQSAENSDEFGLATSEDTQKALARLENLVHTQDENFVTYYDFMNNMLGRTSTELVLHVYDVTRLPSFGTAGLRAFSPALSFVLGVKRLTTPVYQCCLVVDNHEFWYGSTIQSYAPGCTPLGPPTMVEKLPQRNRRSVEEVWDYIDNVLRYEFTQEAFDVDNWNATHLTNALCRYMTTESIPDYLLRQPRIASALQVDNISYVAAWTENTVKAYAQETLRTLSSKVGDRTQGFRRAASSAGEDALQLIDVGDLVRYEYECGWFCVARVVRRGSDTVDLLWCELTSGRVRAEEDVPKSCIRLLTVISNNIWFTDAPETGESLAITTHGSTCRCI